MRILLLAAALALPQVALAQEKKILDALPGLGDGPAASSGQAQRPDAQKIMAELSATLKLSTRQEDRIAKAVNRKTREFDDAMKEYEKYSAEERKWRTKMDASASEMKTVAAGMPDVIREYLDDEQRQSYDEMLAARNKPPKEAIVEEEPQPARKKRVRRKKGEPAPEAVPAEEEAAPAVAAPAGKKKRLVRRKKAAAPAAAPVEEPAPGAAPTGKSAPAEDEDAGSYP